MADTNILTVDLIALGKYALSAFLGSGVASGFIKWLWGKAMDDLKSSLTAEMTKQTTAIDYKLEAIRNDFERAKEQLTRVSADLVEGAKRFKSIESELNETQFDLEKKMADVAVKSGEYRLQAAQDYVTHDQLEGEIVKVASRYCFDNCRGKK